MLNIQIAVKNLTTRFGWTPRARKRTRKLMRLSRRLSMEHLEGRQLLTTFTVNTPIDENDGINIGGVSLRDAVQAAATSGDTIRFSTNVVNLTLGDIQFDKSLTIDASMLSGGLTIHAAANHRIFSIIDPTYGEGVAPSVALKHLTLTGSGTVAGSGGVISSEGSLDIDGCTIQNGNATGRGGGLFVALTGSAAQLRMVNSTVSGNTSMNAGGGIYALAA